MAGKPDPYAGIDFEEINEASGLESDEIKCLKTCFDLFDSKKQDFLSADDLDEILRAMGSIPPVQGESEARASGGSTADSANNGHVTNETTAGS